MNHVLFQVLLFDKQLILNHYQVDLSKQKLLNKTKKDIRIKFTRSFDCSKRFNKIFCSSLSFVSLFDELEESSIIV